jgi:hypothetical protein
MARLVSYRYRLSDGFHSTSATRGFWAKHGLRAAFEINGSKVCTTIGDGY